MSFSADWLRAEQRRGHAAIAPEGAPWLVAEDWHVHALTRAGQEVRIVALWAKAPRQGAFRRLVAGIRAAGLTPVVVEPFGAMRCVRDVALSGWWKSSPQEVTACVAEDDCVAVRRGGEQSEANEAAWQDDEPVSAAWCGEPAAYWRSLGFHDGSSSPA